MKATVPRLSLFLTVLLLAAGCVTTREGASQPPASRAADGVLVGQVSTSGTGLMPSYGVLQLTLRREAARQFRVPEEQISLGSIETAGGRAIESAAQFEQVGSATIQLPPATMADSSHWSATAEVRVKPPVES